MSAPLSAADLRFINDVAVRRYAAGESHAVDEAALGRALEAAAEGTAYVRAATLAAGLLRGQVFTGAPLQTALLVLHCALSLQGFSLVAPQGVLAGMVVGLARDGDAAVVARWLEDRAVPSASG